MMQNKDLAHFISNQNPPVSRNNLDKLNHPSDFAGTLRKSRPSANGR